MGILDNLNCSSLIFRALCIIYSHFHTLIFLSNPQRVLLPPNASSEYIIWLDHAFRLFPENLYGLIVEPIIVKQCLELVPVGVS